MGLIEFFPFQFILKMPESLRDFFIVKKITLLIANLRLKKNTETK